MKKQDEVIAYKAFFKGLKNNLDGITYEIGKEYTTKDKIQYMKGGFHMCEKPEDCFRFLRPSEAEVELALVKGYGNMYGFDAGYRAYDDTLGYIYICEKMQILRSWWGMVLLAVIVACSGFLFYTLTVEESVDAVCTLIYEGKEEEAKAKKIAQQAEIRAAKEKLKALQNSDLD